MDMIVFHKDIRTHFTFQMRKIDMFVHRISYFMVFTSSNHQHPIFSELFLNFLWLDQSVWGHFFNLRNPMHSILAPSNQIRNRSRRTSTRSGSSTSSSRISNWFYIELVLVGKVIWPILFGASQLSSAAQAFQGQLNRLNYTGLYIPIFLRD